MLLNNNLALF